MKGRMSGPEEQVGRKETACATLTDQVQCGATFRPEYEDKYDITLAVWNVHCCGSNHVPIGRFLLMGVCYQVTFSNSPRHAWQKCIDYGHH